MKRIGSSIALCCWGWCFMLVLEATGKDVCNNYIPWQSDIDKECSSFNIERPKWKKWVEGPLPQKKEKFVKWLVDGCSTESTEICKPVNKVYRKVYPRFDGSHNSYKYPGKGRVGERIVNIAKNSYPDIGGKIMTNKRPNPLKVSDMFFNPPKDDSFKPLYGRNAFQVYFGWFVMEEILRSRDPTCPPDKVNVKIPEEHPYGTEGATEMPFARSTYDKKTGEYYDSPRTLENQATPWLDGSAIYGTSKLMANSLRTQFDGEVDPDGMLASDQDGLFPEYNWRRLPMDNLNAPVNQSVFTKLKAYLPSGRLYMTGGPSSHETPARLAISVLWFRWHNLIATYLQRSRKHYLSSDTIFMEARKWVVATLQNIVIYEWMPAFLDNCYLPSYKASNTDCEKETEASACNLGHNPYSSPNINSAFATAGMRMAHSMVPSGINLRHDSRRRCLVQPYSISGNGSSQQMRLCNSYWTSDSTFKSPMLKPSGASNMLTLENVILGLAAQYAEKLDTYMVDDLRRYFYGPIHFNRMDLAAIDIQRGRDFGLPDLAALVDVLAPEELQLNRKNLRTMMKDNELWKRLVDLYGGIDNVDALVGLMLYNKNGRWADFMREFLAEQFMRLRESDSFWFENLGNELFTMEEICRIRQIKMSDVIMAVTPILPVDLQEQVFLLPNDFDSNTNQRKKDKFPLHDSCLKTMTRSDCRGVKPGGTKEYIEKFSCWSVQLGPKLEQCTNLEMYSIGEGNLVDIELVLLQYALMVLASMCTLKYLVSNRRGKWRKYVPILKGMAMFRVAQGRDLKVHMAMEYMGPHLGSRPTLLYMNHERKGLEMWSPDGGIQRFVPLHFYSELTLMLSRGGQEAFLLLPKQCDVCLQFVAPLHRELFKENFTGFLGSLNVTFLVPYLPMRRIMEKVVTMEHRQEQIEVFFDTAYSLLKKAYDIPVFDQYEMSRLKKKAASLKDIELDRHEFANALSMDRDSPFLEKMYSVFDRDLNGTVSLYEFLDTFVIISIGSARDKAKLMFNLHDVEQNGYLTRHQFSDMIKTLVAGVKSTISTTAMEELVRNILRLSNLELKSHFTLDDFLEIFGENKELLGYSYLDVSGQNIPPYMLAKGFGKEARRDSSLNSYYKTLAKIGTIYGLGKKRNVAGKSEFVIEEEDVASGGHVEHMKLYVKHKWQDKSTYRPTLLLMFLSITIFLVEVLLAKPSPSFDSDLLRPYIRGSGSAITFLVCIEIITACRNLFTLLAGTELRRMLSLEMAIDAHKFISVLILKFSIIHMVLGLVVSYMMGATDNVDASCFRLAVYPQTDTIMTFLHYLLGTDVGKTAMVLFILLSIIYVFSTEYSRRYVFRAFRITHRLTPLVLICIYFHAVSHYGEPSIFAKVMLWPTLVVYLSDTMRGMARRKQYVHTKSVKFLPSGVFKVTLVRPTGFIIEAGQFIRVSSMSLTRDEFHPFYVASGTLDATLDLYIKVVGPWTFNLKHVLRLAKNRGDQYPRMRLEGPFGSVFQKWSSYQVVLIVAKGVGIIPFISIIKDITHYSAMGAQAPCEKVFLFWMTDTQASFEWVIDIFREAEERDLQGLLSIHIFMTVARNKFSWRTTMVYLCERHFQKSENRSLFTGLRALTHFRHPKIQNFLIMLKKGFRKCEYIGVLYSGDRASGKKIQNICNRVNAMSGPIVDFHM